MNNREFEQKMSQGQPSLAFARPDCGVCWDDQEHDRGYCQSADGQATKRHLDYNAQPDGPSEKQMNFLRTLFKERCVTEVDEATFEDVVSILSIDKMTRKQASALIDNWLTLPRKQMATAGSNKPQSGLDLRFHLPKGTGYYAVPGGDTRLKLKIDNVEDGKWGGWVFVKDAAVYGQGKRYGTQRPEESYRGEAMDALTMIAMDPQAAMQAYGKLVGKCGRCNRPLEDEESVALGIGPVCRNLL